MKIIFEYDGNMKIKKDDEFALSKQIDSLYAKIPRTMLFDIVLSRLYWVDYDEDKEGYLTNLPDDFINCGIKVKVEK